MHWYLMVVFLEEKEVEVWDPQPEFTAFTRRLFQVKKLVSKRFCTITVAQNLKEFVLVFLILYVLYTWYDNWYR